MSADQSNGERSEYSPHSQRESLKRHVLGVVKRLCSQMWLVVCSLRERSRLPREQEVHIQKSHDDEMPVLERTKSSLASKPRTELEKELIALIDSTKDRLLANMIINGGIRILHLKDTVGAALVVASILSTLIYLTRILFSRVFSQSPLPLSLASALASSIIAFSLGAVKILHDNVLPPNAK